MAEYSELDAIKHLLEIEKQASKMIEDAKIESEKKLSEAKSKFNSEYKEKYDMLVKELEENFNKQKDAIVKKHNEQILSFKNSWQEKQLNVEAFNKYLDKILF